MSENTLEFKINGNKNMDILYGVHGTFASNPTQLFDGGVTHTVLSDYGEMLFQGIPTRFGSIWLSKYLIDKPAKLSAEANASSLELMHMLDGNISFAPDGIRSPLNMKSSHWQLMYLPHVKNKVEFPAGTNITTLDIHIDVGFLENLAPYFPQLDSFLSKASSGRAGTISMQPIPISKEVFSIMAGFLKTRGCAKDQALFLERHLSDWMATAIESSLLSVIEQNFLSPAEEKRLVEVFEYMIINMSDPLPIDQLSRLAQMNEYKFKKGFKALFKKPVHELLTDERMKKALQLLQEEELPLIDIAFHCGYDSYPGFSKEFKKKYGLPPSNFRKKLRN